MVEPETLPSLPTGEPPLAGEENAPEVLAVRESSEDAGVSGREEGGFALPDGEGGADPSGLILPLGYDDDPAVAEGELAGRGTFRLSLDLGATYDSNIFISPREEVADTIFVIQPGVTIGLGDAWDRRDSYLYLNYSPAAAFFVETTSENAVDQDVAFEAGFRGGKTGVTVSARFQNLHGSVADIGDRADRLVYQAGVTLTYGWGAKTSIETGFSYEKTDYDAFFDSEEIRNETFLSYAITGKTTLGLGGAIGRLDAVGSGSRDFVQPLLRARTEPTGKLAFAARAGVDIRESEAGSDTTPVFGLGSEYRPAEGTVIVLDAERSVNSSASSSGDDYIRTAASLGVQQRLASRFNVGISGGVESLDYRAATADASGDREDTGYFVRPNIAYDFRENLRGELFFLYRDNDSTDALEGYTSHQLGVSLGADF